MVKIRIAKGALKSSFPWVKKDAIYKEDYRILSDLSPGDIVELVTKDESYFAYFSNEEKVVFKIFSQTNSDPGVSFSQSFESAFRLRERLKINSNAVRLFFSEADGFPGITVDQYADVAVVTVSSQGLLRHRDKMDEMIKKVTGLETLWLTDHVKPLELKSRVIFEGDAEFLVDFEHGHKTGFYLDQRQNRFTIRDYVSSGARVLDLFCYTGGFGIHCFKSGAKEVVFVDEGKNVVETLEQNIRLNKLVGAKVFRRNVFDFLSGADFNNYFDLVICDPPAFTSSRENVSSATWGYKKLLKGLVKVVKSRGYFAIFSCSWHINLDALIQLIAEFSRDTGISVKVLRHLFQDADHPFVPTFPPSLYLKGLLCYVEKPG